MVLMVTLPLHSAELFVKMLPGVELSEARKGFTSSLPLELNVDSLLCLGSLLGRILHSGPGFECKDAR